MVARKGGGQVVALCPNDRVRQDGEPIATIYRNLGTASAEQVVARALSELAITMAGLAAHVRAQDLQDMDRQLRRLQRMSENLGMISLGMIAADLRDSLAQGDMTAFAAVWARLMRVAERSLATDRDLLGQQV
jgi:chemotaxis protein histidine kinase CheA